MKRILTVALCLAATISFADTKKALDKVEKASREAFAGNLPRAERMLRDAVQEDPTLIRAHLVLANVLSDLHKYGAASDEYSAALELDKTQKKLSEDQRRITLNQRALTTALGGNLPKAKDLLDSAIQQDPDYGLFYYSLACTHAEMGNLDPALENLQKAWERRKNLAAGDRFPDPRKDISFKRYLNNAQFQDAVRNMVF